MKRIGCLVSGHGEVEALPVLVRRVLHEHLGVFELAVGRPIRKSESSLLKVGDDLLERTTTRLRSTHDAVLVLLDLEDDCPAEVAPALLERERSACPDKPCAVVCAYRELETWFVFDAENLWSQPPPDDPEARRGSKEWIRAHAQPGYNERADSPRLCARIDLEHVRATSDSFRVLLDRIEALAVALV